MLASANDSACYCGVGFRERQGESSFGLRESQVFARGNCEGGRDERSAQGGERGRRGRKAWVRWGGRESTSKERGKHKCRIKTPVQLLCVSVAVSVSVSVLVPVSASVSASVPMRETVSARA